MAVELKRYFAHAEVNNSFNNEDGMEIIVDGLHNLEDSEKGFRHDPTKSGLVQRIQEYRIESVNQEIDELQRIKREVGDYLSTRQEDEFQRETLGRFEEAPVYEIEIKVRKIGYVDKDGNFQEE